MHRSSGGEGNQPASSAFNPPYLSTFRGTLPSWFTGCSSSMSLQAPHWPVRQQRRAAAAARQVLQGCRERTSETSQEGLDATRREYNTAVLSEKRWLLAFVVSAPFSR